MSDTEEFIVEDESNDEAEEHQAMEEEEVDGEEGSTTQNLLTMVDALCSSSNSTPNKTNKTDYDRTVNRKRNRDNIICFYCDDFVLRSTTTVVPTNPLHRQDCFIYLASGDTDVATRMEIQFQKYPSARSLCHRHMIKGWRTCKNEAIKWIPDKRVIENWLERLEDERLLRFMTPEYAREKYGPTSIANCTRRCTYCRKTSYSSLLFPMDEGHHKRGFSTWINALALGDENVASLLRADVMHYSRKNSFSLLPKTHHLSGSRAKCGGGGARLCCHHFLRSQFVGNPLYKTNGVVVAMRLRPGEAPTGDPDVVRSLLEIHSKVKAESGDTSEETAVPIQSTSAEENKMIDPIPITLQRTMMKNNRVFTYYLDWPYLDADGNERNHRFFCKTKINEKMFCQACKACYKEIHDTYTNNVVDYKRSLPKGKGNCKNAYAIWLSDNKTWLKTQFTYKVFEFSAKAKLIWDKQDEATRAKYYAEAEEYRWKRDIECAENMKKAEAEFGLRPPCHGQEPSYITVVNKMLLTDPDELKHLCMNIGRPFTEEHMVDHEYVPPPLPLTRFGEDEEFNKKGPIVPITDWSPDPRRVAELIRDAGPKGNMNSLVKRPEPLKIPVKTRSIQEAIEEQQAKARVVSLPRRRSTKIIKPVKKVGEIQLDPSTLAALQSQLAEAVEQVNREIQEKQDRAREHEEAVADVMAMLKKD